MLYGAKEQINPKTTSMGLVKTLEDIG